MTVKLPVLPGAGPHGTGDVEGSGPGGKGGDGPPRRGVGGAAGKPYEPDDPSVLVGHRVAAGGLDAMAEAVVEEYVRLGLDDARILKLFRSPAYGLTHGILRARGEAYVQRLLREARARWGVPTFAVQRGRDA